MLRGSSFLNVCLTCLQWHVKVLNNFLEQKTFVFFWSMCLLLKTHMLVSVFWLFHPKQNQTASIKLFILKSRFLFQELSLKLFRDLSQCFRKSRLCASWAVCVMLVPPALWFHCFQKSGNGKTFYYFTSL